MDLSMTVVQLAGLWLGLNVLFIGYFMLTMALTILRRNQIAAAVQAADSARLTQERQPVQVSDPDEVVLRISLTEQADPPRVTQRLIEHLGKAS
jgi:hypothetical protein